MGRTAWPENIARLVDALCVEALGLRDASWHDSPSRDQRVAAACGTSRATSDG